MLPKTADIVVVGAGIVGLATAMRLLEREPLDLVVLEAEEAVAAHQTGHNSGVVHSGLYYRPGSLKARLCVEGRAALERFCAERGIRHERCGKLVVATTPAEIARLDELERRGRANGLTGIARLRDRGALRAIEPHVGGREGLAVAETGIVDYREVAEAFAAVVRERGGAIATRAAVRAVRMEGDRLRVETDAGTITARGLVNCAGLRSDRLALACGVDPGVRIVPFRGEYWRLTPEAARLVRHLIYPVPDPRYPFLGVHFTRRISGEVEAGPNALLALKREGYGRWSFSAADALGIFGWPGSWRLFARHARTGIDEWRRALSRRALVRDLGALVPEIVRSDLVPGGAGVRAQAVGRDGALVDDFRIVESLRAIHVVNAPSPAATAAWAIGDHVAAQVAGTLRAWM